MPDVDAAVDRVVVLVPAEDDPQGVRSAYLRDPDVSTFSVYRFGAPAPSS